MSNIFPKRINILPKIFDELPVREEVDEKDSECEIWSTVLTEKILTPSKSINLADLEFSVYFGYLHCAS